MLFSKDISEPSEISEKKRPASSKGSQTLTVLFYLVTGLLIVAAGLRLIAALQLGLDWVSYRPDSYWRPGSEGLVLDETLRIRHGLPSYGPITDTSFISGPYPPVFYYLSAFVMNFTGENMLAGRLISFLAALGSAMLIMLLLLTEIKSQSIPSQAKPEDRLFPFHPSSLIPFIAGAALLTTPPFLIWASRNRADVLMVFFALAGCYALLKWQPPSGRYWWPALSILAFVLACYTKQTALVAPAAATLWLILRNPKAGLAYGASLAGSLLLPFLALEIITKHEFYRHMVSYHALPWSGSDYVEWLKTFAADNWGWLVVALGLIGVCLFLFIKGLINSRVIFSDPNRKSFEIPLSALVCGASLLGTITIGVKGGDHNHLLLPAAGICWAAGMALAKLMRQPGLLAKVAGLVVAIVLVGQLWVGWDERLNYYGFDLNKPSPANQARIDGILKYIKTVNGPILSEEVALPALAGKTVEYNDVFTMGALSTVGKWKPQALAEQIRQKHFKLILLPIDLERTSPSSRNIWPPELLQAIKENYYVKFRDVWFIYEPKV